MCACTRNIATGFCELLFRVRLQLKQCDNNLEILVDLVGIEPTTSSMPWKRAPSCATGPLWEH